MLQIKKEVFMLEVNSIYYKTSNRFMLSNISASFKPGQFSMIIGPNGSGKSSLLKIISGDLIPDNGQVKYGNKTLDKSRLKEIAKVRTTMSQHSLLSFPMTVEEVVMMGRYPHFRSRPSLR